MRVALIHDYLVAIGGAEKTFKALTNIFPKADLYTLFYNESVKKKLFPRREIKTSFLQKWPSFLKKKYRWLLPLMPVAIETLDFRDYDLVISSSFSFSKGLITRPKTKHLCYCYSPTRYLWDAHKANFFFNYFRLWDRQASERVDQFIAISQTIRQRIEKYYRRSAEVIYPPTPLGLKASKNRKKDKEFYLIVSRLKKYKRIDLAVKAFNKLGLKLIIIGEGPEKKKLKKMAQANIKLLGWQSEKRVKEYYQKCTALIFPAEDDLGLTPLEAMSYGKPVLAYGQGGVKETVIEGQTGEFFNLVCPNSASEGDLVAVLVEGLRRLRQNIDHYRPSFIKQRAAQFNHAKFKKEILKQVEKVVSRS